MTTAPSACLRRRLPRAPPPARAAAPCPGAPQAWAGASGSGPRPGSEPRRRRRCRTGSSGAGRGPPADGGGWRTRGVGRAGQRAAGGHAERRRRRRCHRPGVACPAGCRQAAAGWLPATETPRHTPMYEFVHSFPLTPPHLHAQPPVVLHIQGVVGGGAALCALLRRLPLLLPSLLSRGSHGPICGQAGGAHSRRRCCKRAVRAAEREGRARVCDSSKRSRGGSRGAGRAGGAGRASRGRHRMATLPARLQRARQSPNLHCEATVHAWVPPKAPCKQCCAPHRPPT